MRFAKYKILRGPPPPTTNLINYNVLSFFDCLLKEIIWKNITTVLKPNKFTVYESRRVDELGDREADFCSKSGDTRDRYRFRPTLSCKSQK